MRRSRALRTLVVTSVLALVAAACGSDDGGASPNTAPSTTVADAAAETSEMGDDNTRDADGNETGTQTDTDTTDTTADTDDGGGPGDFAAGDEHYRVVNLLDEPVDVYVRTEGLVEAYLMESGVAPGEVTPFHAAPDGGRMVVLQAGASDPTCVATCPHILASVRASGDMGRRITSVLYVDDFSGQVRVFDAWEEPLESDIASANRMPDADPDAGLIVPLSIAVADNDFGLRLAIVGVAGCRENRDDASALVGGTVTWPYAYDGESVSVVFHDNTDRDCAAGPVGGPFEVVGGPGTRTLLVLSGSPGDLDALVLSLDDPQFEDRDPIDTGGGSASADTREVALAEMTTFLIDNLTITAAQADCLAVAIVDDVGADQLVDASGSPLDLALVDDALGDELFDALFDALAGCGLDPSILE